MSNFMFEFNRCYNYVAVPKHDAASKITMTGEEMSKSIFKLTGIPELAELHDIHIVTAKRREFIICICECKNENQFDLVLHITDTLTPEIYKQDIYKKTVGDILPSKWILPIKEAGKTPAKNCFAVAIEKIQLYLSNVDSDDFIARVYNPCNTPFISKEEQNAILRRFGIEVEVVVK